MELDEEAGYRVEHLVPPRAKAGTTHQMPVGEGVLDVASDDCRRLLIMGSSHTRSTRPTTSADRVVRSSRKCGKPGTRCWRASVVAPSGRDAFLLVDEHHRMPMDAGRHLDQPLMNPIVDRLIPGQIEEIRVPGTDQ